MQNEKHLFVGDLLLEQGRKEMIGLCSPDLEAAACASLWS